VGWRLFALEQSELSVKVTDKILPIDNSHQEVPFLRAARENCEAVSERTIIPNVVITYAPPPVETWLNLSSTPYFLATVAVSPPPIITVVPFFAASTAASKVALVPLANLSNSKTPGGLFT